MSKNLENILRKIIWVSTFAVLLSPLVYNKYYFFPFTSPRAFWIMAFVQIVFFAWLVLAIYKKKYRPQKNILAIVIAVFLLSLFISALLGPNFQRSFWSGYHRMSGILMILHASALFLVASSFFKKREDWIKIFLWVLGISAITAFFDLGAKTGLWEYFSDDAGSTFGNTSFFGTHLMFSAFLGIWLYVVSANKKIKYFTAAMLVPIVLSLYLSTARAALISFAGGMLLIGLFYLAFRSKQKVARFVGKAGIAAGIAGSFAGAYLLFQDGSIVNRWFTGLATSARLVIWEMAWKGFLDKPIFGWGAGGFEWVAAKYYNPCLDLSRCGGEPFFDRAHNIILDNLVAGGVVGLLVYLALIVVPVFVLWRAYFKKQEEDNAFTFWTAAVFTGLIGAYFLQNLTVFDTPSSYVMFFLILGTVGALFFVQKSEKDYATKFKIKPIFAFITSLVILIFLLNLVIIAPAKANKSIRFAVLLPAGTAERLSLVKQGFESTPFSAGQVLIELTDSITELSKDKKKTAEIGVENVVAELIFYQVFLQQQIKENPLDYRAQYFLTRMFNALSEFAPSSAQSAEQSALRMIELSPTNPRGYWELARAQVNQGNMEVAYATTQKAIEVQPNLFNSYAIAISIAQNMGDTALLEQTIQQVRAIDPEWEQSIRKYLETRNTE